MLEVKNLYFKKGNCTLSNLSFSVPQGEHLYIAGPSGSGKTLILELIAGRYEPLEGSISFRGTQLIGRAPGLRYCALHYQDALLFKSMNVIENVALPLKLKGLPKAKRQCIAHEYLELVEAGHLHNRRCAHLSAGEAQRVSLARALCSEAEILLLDEPYSALDPSLKERTSHTIQNWCRDKGITVVEVSHEDKLSGALFYLQSNGQGLYKDAQLNT